MKLSTEEKLMAVLRRLNDQLYVADKRASSNPYAEGLCWALRFASGEVKSVLASLPKRKCRAGAPRRKAGVKTAVAG